MNYIPLSVKTDYELLSSVIKVDDLISFCLSNNINAIGITDSNMFSSYEIVSKCVRNNIKPIIGVSFNIDEYNMTLYAKNYDGYIDLINLVSIRNISNLTIDDFISRKDNVICVIDDYIQYSKYTNIYSEVYIKYNDLESKNNALRYTDKIVFMEDNCCINKKDLKYLVYLNMIRDGKNINEKDNYDCVNYIDKDIDEFEANTTKQFTKLIDIKLPKYEFELPKYTDNSIDTLNYLCNKGLNKRLNGSITKEYQSRLDMELKVINEMKFTDYFLIVYDFILYAKKNNIVVGPGRGSAAGSLVSYSLGITEIDPIKFNLIFERFLNPDRITMPDIDIDIEYLKRDKLIEYCVNKYGRDKVANVIAFGTLLPKQVIRDVGRVLLIDSNIIDMLCKSINKEETFNELKSNKEFITLVGRYNLNEFINVCIRLEGLKRHTTIHAAGVVISSTSLTNKAPLYKSGDTIMVGYEKDTLESIGLLKMDFLAIKNLTTIDTILNMIKEEKGINIDLNKIPLDDALTLKVFNEVNTIGIFQFESEGMMSFLKSLKVRSFDDIVLSIALYRPGPRDNIPNFLSVREGKSKPSYIIPSLEGILKSTNGIIIYQEQILDILKKIGGFTYSEADNIRRAMSKKKEDVISQYRDTFIKGSVNNGYSVDDANKIYDLVFKFASYGFNKSHSVAYSLVAYQMAFLKAHFPEHFIKILLDTVIGNSVKTNEYISEAKRFDLLFIRPDVNKSTDKYINVEKSIVLPLNSIKNIGKECATSIMEARINGIFIDIYDFFKRVYSSKVNTKAIEALVLSGCLDNFGYNRHTLINNINSLIEYSNLCKDLDESLVLKPEIEICEEYEEKYLLEKEYELFGFYINNHPVSKYKKDNMCPLKNVKNYFNKVINTVVLIDSIKEINTKNNEKMAFISVSDETDKITLIMFPRIYERFYNLNKGDILQINAKVERRLSDYQLIANNVNKL